MGLLDGGSYDALSADAKMELIQHDMTITSRFLRHSQYAICFIGSDVDV